MRFSCGVFIGFILAAVTAGAIYYFRCLRDDPEALRQNIRSVENKWNAAKQSGDKVVDTIKEAAPPPSAQPQTETEKK